MPELRDAGFSVQEQVRQTDFDKLLQRGHRRRTRNHLLLTTGATATAGIVAAAVILGPNTIAGESSPGPIAPQPTVTAVEPDSGLQRPAANGDLTGLAMTSPDRWASAWKNCSGTNCTYAAKLVRGEESMVTDALTLPVTVLSFSDPLSSDSEPDPIALALPADPPRSAADPAWKNAKLYRLSGSGWSEQPVRYAGETTSFGPGDLVTGELIGGEISVLDVREGELKRLKLPAGVVAAGSVQRDQAGRLWLAADKGNGSIAVAWTDDGKTWEQHDLEADQGDEALTAELAITADGKTVVALPIGDGTTTAALLTASISTDRGKTWKMIDPAVEAIAEPPVTMTEGGVLFLGQLRADMPKSVGVYLLKPDGSSYHQKNFPKLQTFRSSGGGLFYGQTGPRTAVVSTDAGRTWADLPLE